MSDTAIDRAISGGRLFPIFRTAFGVGHGAVGDHGRLVAAVLACGDGTVLSHGSAAASLGLWERQPRVVHVIAPRQAGRKIDDIYRHFVPRPLPHQVLSHQAVPVTGPSRTIVDLAGWVGEASLRSTVEQAAVLGLLDVAEIDRVLAGPRRRGSPRLRGILDDWRRYSPLVRLRSPMEAKLLSALSRRDVPIPLCNERLVIRNESFEVDFLWPHQRLVVETDGSKYHDNPIAEARDRHRDHALEGAGYLVIRIGWQALSTEPQRVLTEIIRLLRDRSAAPSPHMTTQRNSAA